MVFYCIISLDCIIIKCFDNNLQEIYSNIYFIFFTFYSFARCKRTCNYISQSTGSLLYDRNKLNIFIYAVSYLWLENRFM